MQNFLSISHLEASFALLKRMRETQPVMYDEESNSWHIFCYSDVLYVLSHPQQFSPATQSGPVQSNAFHLNHSDSLSQQHMQYLMTHAFTPRYVTQLIPHMTSLTQSILDQAHPTGKMDVINELAIPLSLFSLSHLIGSPPEQWPELKRMLNDLQPTTEQTHVPASGKTLTNYLRELLEEHRRHPRQNFMSGLLDITIDGTPLHDDEIIAFCTRILTITHQILPYVLGNTLFCLDRNPKAINLLCTEPAPFYSTIEEVLRYLPPIWHIVRKNSSELTLGKQHIPAHSSIYAWLISANHDPKQFAQPEYFDIGIALVREETKIALSLLLKNYPTYKRDPDYPLEFIDNPSIFGTKNFPITLVNS
jgi:cytochrome P450 family 109